MFNPLPEMICGCLIGLCMYSNFCLLHILFRWQHTLLNLLLVTIKLSKPSKCMHIIYAIPLIKAKMIEQLLPTLVQSLDYHYYIQIPSGFYYLFLLLLICFTLICLLTISLLLTIIFMFIKNLGLHIWQDINLLHFLYGVVFVIQTLQYLRECVIFLTLCGWDLRSFYSNILVLLPYDCGMYYHVILKMVNPLPVINQLELHLDWHLFNK